MSKSKEVTLEDMRRKLWLLGVFKIPMLAYCRPKLLSLDDQKVRVSIRLTRRTKNHLGSMYFGALSVGADVTGGILAFYFAETLGLKISFAFKSFEAQFLQRAESDIEFVCEEGDSIRQLVDLSKDKQERQNRKVKISAWDKSGTNVANFILELSVKVK